MCSIYPQLKEEHGQVRQEYIFLFQLACLLNAAISSLAFTVIDSLYSNEAMSLFRTKSLLPSSVGRIGNCFVHEECTMREEMIGKIAHAVTTERLFLCVGSGNIIRAQNARLHSEWSYCTFFLSPLEMCLPRNG